MGASAISSCVSPRSRACCSASWPARRRSPPERRSYGACHVAPFPARATLRAVPGARHARAVPGAQRRLCRLRERSRSRHGSVGGVRYGRGRSRALSVDLAHYYGGTKLSSRHNLVSKDPLVRVDLNENDRHPVVVTSASAFSFGGHVFRAGRAARAVLSSGRWTLSQAPACASAKWSRVATGLLDPVRQAGSVLASAPESQVLVICEANGAVLPVRGTVEAYASPFGAVTLSVLPIEEYLRASSPDEVSWSWALFGGVAARRRAGLGIPGPGGPSSRLSHYVAAELATVAGAAMRRLATTSASPTRHGPTRRASRMPLSRTPAGEILEAHGAPFSPSTRLRPAATPYGGQFPAVPDRGDSVCIKSSY